MHVYEERSKRQFGDLGRFSIRSVTNVLSAPVRAVSSAVSSAITPISGGIFKLGRSFAKPVASVATAVAKPVVSTVKMSTGLVNKLSMGNPLLKAVAAFTLPGAAVAVAPSLAQDYKAMQQAKNQPVETVVPDGPLVNIYAPDGSQAQIPNNYLSASGTYTEAGVTWSINPPKMVTIYSPYGDVGEIPEGLLSLGKYKDENGNIWTTTAPKMVTIYSPYGDVAEIPDSLLSLGKYKDEKGNVWTTTAPASSSPVSRGMFSPLPPTMVTLEPVKTMPSVSPLGTPVQTAYLETQAASQLVQPVSSFQPPVNTVTVYAADGSVGEVPANLVSNGQYMEDGVLWTTAPQNQSQQEAPNMVTVYAADGSVGEVSADLVKNGKYSEDGVLWTTTPQNKPASGMTLWQKFLAALQAGNARAGLSGLGEDISMAPGTDLSTVWDQNQSSTASLLDKLASTVAKVKATATSGRKVVQAVRGKSSSSAVPGSIPAPQSNTIMGLPPAVVYGAGAAAVAGIGYVVVKKIRNRK